MGLYIPGMKPLPPGPIDVRVTEDQQPLDVNVIGDESVLHPPTPLLPVEPPTEPELAARGRAEERVTVAGSQRRVNLMWEVTQAVIAVSVCEAVLYVAVINALNDPAGAAFVLLAGLANLVIGFYFGRTNHTRTGGTGERSTEFR